MKKHLLSILFAVASTFSMAQTATDFTANDCSGNSHNLFTELNAGKVIVLCWAMPCGACVAPSLTTHNVVQGFQGTNPNTVFFYLCDDYANTSCASLNSWGNSNGMPQSSFSLRFSNASINMLNYGSTGMPKIVVLGGANHTVFYNSNNTVNAAALQYAINSALAVTGINEPSETNNSLSVIPNPALNSAEIAFSLERTSDVTLELFSLEGKKVKKLFSGQLNAGENKIAVNLEKFSAGMYLVKFSDGNKNRFVNLVKAE